MSHAPHEATSTSRLALQATIHCLTGCGIGEVLVFPVNRWLIARGLGHAVVHGAHS
jgi:hypothetical protein